MVGRHRVRGRAEAARPTILAACVVGSAALVGCGSRTPKVLDSTEQAQIPRRTDGAKSEPEKIRELVSVVRHSGYTFTQDGKERDAASAAADMERRLARNPAGVPTARQFVERVGAGKLRAKEPDTLRLADGTVVTTRDWLLARLAEIEGVAPSASGAGDAAPAPRAPPPEVGILDALTVVERSSLRFVAPPRRSHSGKLRGKRKEYSGPEFAEMLRKKWEFLGADIKELDPFIDQIASDAFASMERYRVIHPDGGDEEFRAWLLAQLDERRDAIARGG
jgi:hypothetical protein